MKKLISMLLLLLLMAVYIPCASAETAIPAEVQAFYDLFCENLERYGVPVDCALQYTNSYEEYAMAAGIDLLIITASRAMYDEFYYWTPGEMNIVSVCCIDGKPAAFTIDGCWWDIVCGNAPYWESSYAFTDTFSAAYPADRQDFYFDMLMMSDALDIYNEELTAPILDDTIAYDDVLVSCILQNDITGMYTMQILPYDAYEGLEFDAAGNHDMTMYGIYTTLQFTLDALLDSMQ